MRHNFISEKYFFTSAEKKSVFHLMLKLYNYTDIVKFEH